MPKPTAEQLEKINSFAMTPLTEDSCYVFDNLMIDNLETSYSSRIHPNLLSKFHADTLKGVGLLTNHNSRQLPVGRSFDARMEVEGGDSGAVVSLYGSFYIDLGRRTESQMLTDDIAKGIDAGIISDTSVGFTAEKWECSICGNDIRNYNMCPHYPGREYPVTRDGVLNRERCVVIVGADGNGELLENSLVFAGACGRASIQHSLSAEGVKDFNVGTKLRVVDDFKNIPTTATIYQHYSKNGVSTFVDTDESTGGALVLRQRSEEVVEETNEILGIEDIVTPEAVEPVAHLAEAQSKTEDDLKAALAEIDKYKQSVEELSSAIAVLQNANKELVEKAALGEAYRQDLVTKALEAGVRAHGNAFNTELFAKFLNTLSLNEVKDALAGLEAEVAAKYENARVARPTDRSVKTRVGEELTADDFESETEFRAFVADKAILYAKENGISLTAATTLMYTKYNKSVD